MGWLLRSLLPIWRYGIQIFGNATLSNRCKLHRLQNLAIKPLSGSPRYERNSIFHSDQNLALVEDEIHFTLAENSFLALVWRVHFFFMILDLNWWMNVDPLLTAAASEAERVNYCQAPAPAYVCWSSDWWIFFCPHDLPIYTHLCACVCV